MRSGFATPRWKGEVRYLAPMSLGTATPISPYMHSEGCACCQNIDAHKKHAAELAKLLRVPKYPDGSGYNFGKFRAVDKTAKP